ncbi:D-2-hydroxyacid dehydrogenase [Bacillus infantis]|uniref:D-2-hydroxyacid dehydrogenase n=1 Tax=Bacillus infantis TaxID=324767 RepID=UPI00101C9B92|nr:D-2-hydroxyacid dehydrogenase [Bacillus infantis]RYI28755.1 D-2-hydroxyacid dehydrogenase [Bacillus infantis]
MKIVVLDGYTTSSGDLSWNDLKQLGELRVFDRTTYDIREEHKVIENIKDAEIVFTNKTPITRSILESVPNVKYIGVLATGYNVVDIEAAKERGIVVTNTPSYGTRSVAQMTFALLLELCHHVGAHSEAVKNGEWEKNLDWCFWNFPLIELADKKLGIIGFGRIGRAVAEIAVAFGMKVLAYSRHRDENLVNDAISYVDLDELLRASDVITLHCPLLEDTKGIINESSINKMKDGVMIINTSRGPLIEEADLAEALNVGKIGGAALDVVSTEPIKSENVLLSAKNCIITPHISWAPKESRKRLMDIAVNNLRSYLDGHPVNIVNRS